MEDDEIQTPKDVAERLKKPLNTLKFWRATGYGPPFFHVGRSVRYRKSDVDGWIAEQVASASRSA